MRIYEPAAKTSVATIERYGAFAARDDTPEAAARAWTEAGFDDKGTADWLEVRCFDPQAAQALATLGVTPRQAAAKTRDGGGDYRDTIAYKVSSGDLTPRQGAARCMSSR